MSVGDDAFGERVQLNFDIVIDKLTSLVGKQNLPDLFEFIESFVHMYHGHFTESNLRVLLQGVVTRVLAEHELLQGAKTPKKTLDLRKGKKTVTRKSTKGFEFRIAKSWSLIRYVAEHPHF